MKRQRLDGVRRIHGRGGDEDARQDKIWKAYDRLMQRADEVRVLRRAHLQIRGVVQPAARPRAVLVYANAATRRFAVIGGEEIRRVAPQAFWAQVHSDLQHHFDDERYCDGLFKAIAQIAIQLHFHFHPTLPEDAPPQVSAPDSKPPF